MTAHAGPLPVPARITMALDAIAAEGPWVDEALGGTEPMVDRWEAGELIPTRAQIKNLAALTGTPSAFFYRPVEEWEQQPVRAFVCDRSRRQHALTILESRVGWDGVLHVRELTPPHPPLRSRPAQLPVPAPQMRRSAVVARRPGGRQVTVHDPIPGDTPAVCAVCGRRTDVPNDAHGAPPTTPEQAAARRRVDPGDE